LLHYNSNLKAILKEREWSIRQLSRETDISYEVLRRIYHDEANQYHRDTLGKICYALNIELSDLIIKTDESNSKINT